MSKSKTRKYLRALIKGYKNRPCKDCRRRLPLDKMSYDHVRGIKLFNLGGSILHQTEETILAEIRKCEVVCLDCHKARESRRIAI